MSLIVIGNTPEAERLAERLDSNVAVLRHTLFPDGEVALSLAGDELGDDMLIYYQFSGREPLDAQILRLVALLQGINNKLAVRLVLPYLPYARSLPWGKGMIVSVAAPMLAAIKAYTRELWTIDLHSEEGVLQAYVGGVIIRELSLCATIAGYLKEKFDEVVLVAPDQGAAGRVRHLAEQLDAPYLVMNKERHSATEVAVTMAKNSCEPGKQYVIVDDIISTGKTLLAAADCLRQKGAERVAGVVTHNVARPETRRSLAAAGIPLYTSNSLAREDYYFDVLECVTAAAITKARQAVG